MMPRFRSSPLAQLRVLGLCDHFSETPAGGSEIVAMQVYRNLADAGAQIRVISATPGVRAGRQMVTGIPTEYVRAHDLSRMVGAQVVWAPAVLTATARAIDEFKPTVVHASSIHFQSALLGSFVAKMRSIPLVTTAHVGSVAHLPLRMRWATNAYEQTLGRALLRRSTSVIAVSEGVRNHLQTLGVPRNRISIVPNGVDLTRFIPGPQLRPLRVAFVGRLIANKGPSLTLDAFARAAVPGADLVFVGEGPLRRTLERQAIAAGIQSSVRFLGYRDDVERVLATSAVLVRPSMTEGQSLAILEAMATGTCVIASDIAENRELLDDGRAGSLVPPGEVVALSRAIRLILEDGELRAGFVARARHLALGHSWEACAESTGRVLSAAAQSKNGADR